MWLVVELGQTCLLLSFIETEHSVNKVRDRKRIEVQERQSGTARDTELSQYLQANFAQPVL